MPLFKRVKKRIIPDGLWKKCENCNQIIYNKALEENLKVCPKCNFHFTLGARERIELLLDKDSFKEDNAEMVSIDPLNFVGQKAYKEKIKADQEATGLKEAAVTGQGSLDGKEIMFGVTDSRFIMGSMGSVVGEKITRVVENATVRRLPLVIVSGSGGGARMYEGMLSLMQMAKTSAALARHADAGLPYIPVLTHPTMAGVMASFATLGDVIVAEPGALIGFAGPRVIKETTQQDLPEGFQRAEFLMKYGLIDMVVPRSELRERLILVLEYLCD